MSRLGIDLLSVFGMPPVEHVRLAAELGCSHISTGLTRLPFNLHSYPQRSLLDDAALRQEMKAAMRDAGVVISLGEGFIVRPTQDMRDRCRALDVMAEVWKCRCCSLPKGASVRKTGYDRPLRRLKRCYRRRSARPSAIDID